MEFSDVIQQNEQLSKFSPDSRFLASAQHFRLFIREAQTLQIVNIFTCLDTVQEIEWSPDSKFILCSMFKRAIAQVWSIDYPDWSCKIDEGASGLAAARWSPDSRHVITTSDFHIRMTIWSLLDKSVSYIRNPKACREPLAFVRICNGELDTSSNRELACENGPEGVDVGTQSGRSYMILLERRADLTDRFAVFDCGADWQLVAHFASRTIDCDAVRAFYADGGRSARFCAVESRFRFAAYIYSLDGRCVASYSPFEALLSSELAADNRSRSTSRSRVDPSASLGVSQFAFAALAGAAHQLVAFGAFDSRVRLLNTTTWRCIAEFAHPDRVRVSQSGEESVASDGELLNATVYREVDDGRSMERVPLAGVGAGDTSARRCAVHRTRYELMAGTVGRDTFVDLAPAGRKAPNKPTNVRRGIGLLAFAARGRFLSSRNDSQPNAMWIWNVHKLRLAALLVQLDAVRAAAWHPHRARLALVAGSSRLHFWTPHGAACVHVPSANQAGGLALTDVRWSADGERLVLTATGASVICYLDEQAAGGGGSEDGLPNADVRIAKCLQQSVDMPIARTEGDAETDENNEVANHWSKPPV